MKIKKIISVVLAMLLMVVSITTALAESTTITIEHGDTNITLMVEDSTVYVDGESVELDIPLQTINDMPIPLFFIAALMGIDISFYNGTIIITAIQELPDDYTDIELPYTDLGPSTTMVWLSRTGTRWHSIDNCGTMNPLNARQVTLEYARSRGFEPCRNCDAPN